LNYLLTYNKKLIKEINNITNEIKSMATESKSDYGSGGMQSKIEAAKICMNSGCHTIVASGLLEKPIDNINNTNDYSHFIPQENPLSARKKWIRGMIDSKGSIEIDQGAEMALETAKSLLPVGVRAVEGSFDKGELISIVSKSGDVIGKGMTNFSDLEIEIIKGLKTSEIKSKLGYLTTNEIIHRDNLVLTK
jgi:glutamate 5-kinase